MLPNRSRIYADLEKDDLSNQGLDIDHAENAVELLEIFWSQGIDLIMQEKAYQKSGCLKLFSRRENPIDQQTLLERYHAHAQNKIDDHRRDDPSPLTFAFLSKITLDHLPEKNIENLFKVLHPFQSIASEKPHQTYQFPNGCTVLSINAAQEILALYIRLQLPKLMVKLIDWQWQNNLRHTDYQIDNRIIYQQQIIQQWQLEVKCRSITGEGYNHLEVREALRQIFVAADQTRHNQKINLRDIQPNRNATIPPPSRQRYQI